ncbi:adenylate cyclase [Pseudanabaena sp. lw0831]|uniref:adenylate/guanylate cyclase domain-containing protein n=1 Tax=Pseudanabaena sp. lw0831 TaxID=1357935 RepID=UPI0019155021|nr:adenylate/guanylate cyclase domain-containing protein [Pseudanabaena sp. lw0831]GBO55277.1 adenylate cyclase [Pseudanabaena sp. lw0831]
MFKIPYITKPFKNVPLKIVLVVPFVIQICIATGVIGLFTYRNGQQRVSAIATSLSGEMGDRISTELNSYLRSPNINQPNVDISTFLRGLKYREKERVFIIERSGLVVGTSALEKSFQIVDGKPQRLNILDSKDDISRLAAQYLLKTYGKFDAIQGTEHIEAVLAGEDHFIRVQNRRDDFGLDWIIVIVVPASQFTGSMQNQTETMILLYCAVLAIAILIGMLTARSISTPLRKLSEATLAITHGEIDTRVQIEGTSEIRDLSESFNTLAEMMANSFLQLEKSNQELELRVQERTYELNASKASLQRTNFLLSRRESQLRKQQDILFGLTKDKSINQGNFIDAVQNITRTGSQALNVERVSIWLFDKTKTLLHCLDLYIRSTNTHTEADFLTYQNYPKFFAALQAKHAIAIEDIEEEEYLQELIDSYFRPAVTVSLLIKPFEVDGQVTGIIAFEHVEVEHLWIPEEQSFASSLADLLSLGMESQERHRAEENLRIEQMKSERLLLNVLPQEIVERLKLSQSKALANKVSETYSNQILDISSDPMLENLTNGTNGAIVADAYDEVTVLFADIVNFTEYASAISASDLVNCLNDIFSEFDRLVDLYDLEKIKTIGDSYMAVGGLPVPSKDHAEAIAEMALEMQTSIQKFKRLDGTPFLLRIGIHTGQAIAGVIGTKKFIYDLWGDTVNVASRMESHGVAGCIQVTEATYQLLKNKYRLEQRSAINIKGKGEMITYLLQGRIDI